MKKITLFSIVLLLIAIVPVSQAYASLGRDNKKVITEKSFKISEGKKINIDADGGDIIITTWNRAEVYVKVIGNDNAADKYDFSFKANDDEITVIAERISHWSWFSNIQLKLEIKVPENFNVYANTSGGDIKIGGVHGGIYLKTSGGDIWGDRFEGNFIAKTSGGDINLYCKNAEIKASTSGGDIELEYTGVNQGVELRTSGGDIDIKLPAEFNAKAELKTSGGDVECNLTLNNAAKISGSKINADINQGGKPLIAITSGGDISVKKR